MGGMWVCKPIRFCPLSRQETDIGSPGGRNHRGEIPEPHIRQETREDNQNQMIKRYGCGCIGIPVHSTPDWKEETALCFVLCEGDTHGYSYHDTAQDVTFQERTFT